MFPYGAKPATTTTTAKPSSVPCLDYNQLRQEALTRWLKPAEVLYLLQNHDKNVISAKTPHKPPSSDDISRYLFKILSTGGSLFLYNRRVHRYFRKDGHNWKRKKDGRNVGEGHEKLKVANVDTLTCYYAHEENSYLQRRSYWMLDPKYEHIVLVHYRDVSEGNSLPGSVSNIAVDSSSSFHRISGASNDHHQGIDAESNELYEPSCSSFNQGNLEGVNSEFTIGSSDTNQLHVVEDLRISDLLPHPELSEAQHTFTAQLSLDDDFMNTNFFGENISESQDFDFLVNGKRESLQESHDNVSRRIECSVGDEGKQGSQSLGSGTDTETAQSPSWNDILQFSSSSALLSSHGSSSNLFAQVSDLSVSRLSEHGTHLPTRSVLNHGNSPDWEGIIDFDVADFSEVWTDQGEFGISLGDDTSLTVADNQRFHIREISPEWAFSYESTKVFIIGDFLCDSSEFPWAIMFGEIQVPAEIVQEGVLCCLVPQYNAGKVSLCVTSGNRESCSEVRDFEFRAKTTVSGSTCTAPKKDGFTNPDELLLLARLVSMLLYSSDGPLNGSEVPSDTFNWIMQELLKDKLEQFLSSKYQGGEYVMSKQEQGIIHMISGLGYEWALNPILDSGVGVNFRDANGWTALHWAARFGREKMVAALLAAGASPGALTDPTRLDSAGKTPGAIASSNGHTGLAGYLSEAALVSHLSSLTIKEMELFKGSAEVEAERVVQSISERSCQMHKGGTEDELSLRDYLSAVRNAAQAAARIQAAFRAHSFKERKEMAVKLKEVYGMSISELSAWSSKFQAYDKAALSIQKKYRAWKERKSFLTLRKHVVKIQAYVRGHQERNKFKMFIRMTALLDKAILRWRRKRVGLRGYQAEPELIDEEGEEIEDIVKVFRKQKVEAGIDQAMSRVLSMADTPTARRQYRRMLDRFHEAKVESGISDESTSRVEDDFDILENNCAMYSYKRG